jgi:hypothetical protein
MRKLIVMWRAVVGAQLVVIAACMSAPGSASRAPDPVPPPAADSGPAGRCGDPEAAIRDGHCYLELHSGDVEQAMADCGVFGGYLIAINDAQEQAFIVSTFELVNGDAWIGLERDGNGDWAWMNGEPLSWTRWAPSAPDREADEDCAELEIDQGDCAGGCWNNKTGLDEVQKAICEIEM